LAILMDDWGFTGDWAGTQLNEPNELIGVEEKRPNQQQEWIRRPN
jgi:hypothetical protein